MPRKGEKPLNRPAGPVTGRAALWAAIRELREFTPAELQAATDETPSVVFHTVAGLRQAGYIAPTGERRRRLGRPTRNTVYRLVRDCGVEPPRITYDGRPSTAGLATEQLWRTMRMLGHAWTAAELTATASTTAVPVRHGYTLNYITALKKAGYLVEVARQSRRPSKYRFVRGRDTGPKPPQLRCGPDGRRVVYDPNLDQIVWSPEAGR